MARHVVKQGACVASIAARYGFANARTVYEDPQNAELRQRRPESGVLAPGDEVFIPERKAKEVAVKAGELTSLTVTVPERRILLTVLDGEDRPLVDEPFAIEGDGTIVVGMTDGAGVIDAAVPGNLCSAWLDAGGLSWELALGGLD